MSLFCHWRYVRPFVRERSRVVCDLDIHGTTTLNVEGLDTLYLPVVNSVGDTIKTILSDLTDNVRDISMTMFQNKYFYCGLYKGFLH